MKSLKEYIFEQLDNIFEVTMSGQWSHIHNNDIHFYPKAVIQTLIKNKKVKLGVNADSESNEISDKAVNKLRDINVDDKNAENEFNNIVKEFGFKWSNIAKGPYSGGSSAGGNAEILVCYLFNNPKEENNLNKIAEKYKINSNEWLNSVKHTVNVIVKANKWSNKNYVALQVDGKGTEYITSDQFGNLGKDSAIKIAKLFYDKKSIIENISALSINDISKLYAKKKDEWNKADIILIKNDKNYLKQIQDEFNGSEPKYIGLEGFKKMCLDYTMSDIIIPISLKKTPDESANLYKHNLGEDKISFSIENEGADIELPTNPLKGKNENDDKNGSLYLVLNNKGTPNKIGKNKFMGKKSENIFNVQFYKRASSSNLKPTAKIELQLKNSKGGSGFQQICNALGITTNDSYASYDEVKRGVQEYFNWDLNNLPNVIQSANNWYMKPCFTCLIGLLNKYCEKNKLDHNSDVLLPFTNFVIGACEGDGSYYIIK